MQNRMSFKNLAILSTLLLTTGLVQADVALPNNTTDITRADLAQALINFQAEALMNQYNLNKELLFMGAPGISWAISAGQLISSNATTITNTALNYSNQAFLDGLTPYTNITASSNPSITLSDGTAINLANLPTLSPTIFYGGNQSSGGSFAGMQGFVLGSNPGIIDTINPGLLLQSNVLSSGTGASKGMTAQQALGVVALITNPLPAANAALTNDINSGAISDKNNTNSGTDQQTVAQVIADNVALGVSTSALGDIIARRMPITSGSTTTSIMQTMSDYSLMRFASPDWYDALAGSSDSAILREIAHMHAYALWTQHQQFRIQEQQVALLAAMNSNLARLTNMLSGITQTINTATTQAQTMQSQLTTLNNSVGTLTQDVNNLSGGTTTPTPTPGHP